MMCLAEEGFTTIRLDNVLDYLAGRTTLLPSKPIAITFDDGYLDTYINAFPILVQHGFTATVFIVAERVGKKADWVEAPDIESPALMSWVQIREMSSMGFSFGSHSCTHPQLTSLQKEQLKHEIGASKSIIEQKLGMPVRFFAYPYSLSNDTIKQLVAEAGYSAAFSTRWGLVDWTNDAFALNRLMILNDHELDYFRWVIRMGTERPWYRRILHQRNAVLQKLSIRLRRETTP